MGGRAGNSVDLVVQVSRLCWYQNQPSNDTSSILWHFCSLRCFGGTNQLLTFLTRLVFEHSRCIPVWWWMSPGIRCERGRVWEEYTELWYPREVSLSQRTGYGWHCSPGDLMACWHQKEHPSSTPSPGPPFCAFPLPPLESWAELIKAGKDFFKAYISIVFAP